MNGVSGALLSPVVLDELAGERQQVRPVRRLLVEAAATLGPAQAARLVADRLTRPLAHALGLGVTPIMSSTELVVDAINGGVGLLATGNWGADLRRMRDVSTRLGAPAPRWWIGVNGHTLRIVDGHRAYSRRAADFDLVRLAEDEAAAHALSAILCCDTGRELSVLARTVLASERHRAAVSRSLEGGVEEALERLVAGFAPPRRRQPARLDAALADALTIVYRLLFLLFAEARGLVPQWHPIYRRSYTIESLRRIVERGDRVAGLWESLQAISRLAHKGCRAGTLRVTAFNGRLFAPAAAPLAESYRLDDRTVCQVLLAITTRPTGERRERISYAELGVEQLGAVYEKVLEFVPEVRGDRVALGRTDRRKRTGTFYTPRSITEYLVRRTLAPLVRDRSPDDILSLRILDPAMGSGAFVVAACRYLAEAYARALVRGGYVTDADLTPADRASFRRTIAQRCLYGVDRNPTAVQLARLSLWLCTLAADRPLSFLDHHLRVGNSLVGASPADVARQPPGSASRLRTERVLPLFERGVLQDRLSNSVSARLQLATEPDDSALVVRSKERRLAAIDGDSGPLGTCRRIADAWCAAWFWPAGIDPISPRSWGALAESIRGGGSSLPQKTEAAWLTAVREVTARERFFHWELEFPEIFFDDRGERRANAGFDAVFGNPPWTAARELTGFARQSGCYAMQSDGHANLYQLFAERMLRLTRDDGRIGLLMPAGLTSDHGCCTLRQELLRRCRIDALLGFDNRDAVFPIHRGVRFVLLSAHRGGTTDALPVRFGLRSADALDAVPDEGPVADALSVPTSLLECFSGPSAIVPELRSEKDQTILARIVATASPLGSRDGWHLQFGRELNATDDRVHFVSAGIPVLEGKLVQPFHIETGRVSTFVDPDVAPRLRGGRQLGRPRLGYREVASATNRLTLIAAMIPGDALTSHTIFVLKTALDIDVQWFLCGVFNSYVANYLIRLRGSTHVPAATIEWLAVPRPDAVSLQEIASLSRSLACCEDVERDPAHTRLQARVAQLYQLAPDELRHILTTFPLVPQTVREAISAAFRPVDDAI